MSQKYFNETLYDSLGQEIRIDRLYFQDKTEHQHLVIFHNARLGRVMTLDGVVQTTEADEHVYHEMLTHVPMYAHGNATRVLIIGGGDGGMLREVLKHPVEAVTQVEIDPAVVEMARKYLPNHSAGAFDDPRLDLVFGDGLEFVRDSEQQYDVIISDSTDPIGPGEALFSGDYYRYCHQRLREGGVFVAQNGVPFMQMDELRTTHRRMQGKFGDTAFYRAAVPTYYGGDMAFAWGSDDPALRALDTATIEARFGEHPVDTRYYTPAVHVAAFALPRSWQLALHT